MNIIVRAYLIELARKRFNQTVTYQKLSDDCKLGFNMHANPSDRLAIASILDTISRYEHSFERPLLSALVIRASDSREGDGFYTLAQELGFGEAKKLKKERIFEVSQIKKCISFWEDNENYNLFK
ncbi:hypothetical protein ABS768_06805 [Flavobacterium sp. ST-75]|uniref:Uncharacterized protein n=1 Tax=Flavobacterium rhizophilum TaxID=3163296 RepID=A0ABW8YDB8_9FLAO